MCPFFSSPVVVVFVRSFVFFYFSKKGHNNKKRCFVVLFVRYFVVMVAHNSSQWPSGLHWALPPPAAATSRKRVCVIFFILFHFIFLTTRNRAPGASLTRTQKPLEKDLSVAFFFSNEEVNKKLENKIKKFSERFQGFFFFF